MNESLVSMRLTELPAPFFFVLISVFICTLIVGLFLAKFAQTLQLLAKPEGHRQHAKPTPMVGGLAIFFGLLLGNFMLGNAFANVLPALFILCLIGALDDRFNLPSWARFLVQAGVIYLMIAMTEVKLESLGALLPNTEVHLGGWSTPMTIFAAMGVINAVNMSDGLDGLAASLLVVSLVALLITGGDFHLIMITIAALLAFLSLNLRLGRQQARIFMGDAGSTMLGLLLAYLLIGHSQLTNGIPPVTALWFLALPLIDAVAVLIVRPIRGRSPFTADRTHYHHQLLDLGFGVNQAVLIAVGVQVCCVLFGVFAWQTGTEEYLQLMLFLVLFALYLLSMLLFTKQQLKNKA